MFTTPSFFPSIFSGFRLGKYMPVPTHTLVPAEAPWVYHPKLHHRCSKLVAGSGTWGEGTEISGYSAVLLSQVNDFPAYCNSLPPGPFPAQKGCGQPLASFPTATWSLLPTSYPGTTLCGCCYHQCLFVNLGEVFLTFLFSPQMNEMQCQGKQN